MTGEKMWVKTRAVHPARGLLVVQDETTSSFALDNAGGQRRAFKIVWAGMIEQQGLAAGIQGFSIQAVRLPGSAR
jgi:hypothetical protein